MGPGVSPRHEQRLRISEFVFHPGHQLHCDSPNEQGCRHAFKYRRLCPCRPDQRVHQHRHRGLSGPQPAGDSLLQQQHQPAGQSLHSAQRQRCTAQPELHLDQQRDTEFLDQLDGYHHQYDGDAGRHRGDGSKHRRKKLLLGLHHEHEQFGVVGELWRRSSARASGRGQRLERPDADCATTQREHAERPMGLQPMEHLRTHPRWESGRCGRHHLHQPIFHPAGHEGVHLEHHRLHQLLPARRFHQFQQERVRSGGQQSGGQIHQRALVCARRQQGRAHFLSQFRTGRHRAHAGSTRHHGQHAQLFSSPHRLLQRGQGQRSAHRQDQGHDFPGRHQRGQRCMAVFL